MSVDLTVRNANIQVVGASQQVTDLLVSAAATASRTIPSVAYSVSTGPLNPAALANLTVSASQHTALQDPRSAATEFAVAAGSLLNIRPEDMRNAVAGLFQSGGKNSTEKPQTFVATVADRNNDTSRGR